MEREERIEKIKPLKIKIYKDILLKKHMNFRFFLICVKQQIILWKGGGIVLHF